ncbi:hypothetical protein V5799_010941 [Amblyomma americanum]|uniref:Uncharacterized protein n=1 Tax=Amblyomma americanum TaxID=6943 RepID=A0AAQ4EIU3_AMBAM
MLKKVTSPVKFGEPCAARYAQPFSVYCLEKPPSEQEHSDSLTAVGFNDTLLFTYETAATVDKKASAVSAHLSHGTPPFVILPDCSGACWESLRKKGQDSSFGIRNGSLPTHLMPMRKEER